MVSRGILWCAVLCLTVNVAHAAPAQVIPPNTPLPPVTREIKPTEPAQAIVVPAPGAPISFADLADKVEDAVVNVSTTQKRAVATPGAPPMQGVPMPDFPPGSPFQDFFQDFFNNQMQQQGPMPPSQSLGSGFIINAAEGYVVTNNHVIDQADEIKVILHNDTALDAKLVGRDTKTDLALLKIDPKKMPLKQVVFGDSAKARVGDWVLAVGNPFGLGGSVTAGIISARQRNINAGQYDDFIQTDASINRGNSGGPLFNLRGEVIGINTAIFSPTGGSVGIGFAVPSELAQSVIQQLAQYGETRRGWLGVRIQDVTPEIADTLGLGKVQGALVASVTPNGPAASAGLKAGDIILNFDGKGVEAMRRLPRIVADTDIGRTVPVTVWRQGKTIETKATITQLEKAEKTGLLTDNNEPNVIKQDAPQSEQAMSSLGITVAPLTPQLRQKFNIDAKMTNGVIVTRLNDDSDAVVKGLRPGDVVQEINQVAIKSPVDFNAALEAASKAKKNMVLLLVSSEGNLRFVAVKLKK